MVIKASASGNVKALVEALVSGDDVMRESAIARLAIIGNRATGRLLAAYASAADREEKVALLRAIESVADRRAAPAARDALAEGGDVALAAAGVLRALLASSHTPTATAALDALVSAALNRKADQRVRLAAFESLQEVPGDVRDRVAAALREEGSMPRTAAAADALWSDAVSGRLPEDPAALRDALHTRGGAAPLPSLHKLVDAVRAKESAVNSTQRRAEWRAVRGILHQALALRGSRVALYDLRETVEGASGPLPVSYLAALHVLGDASCLEPIAAAYSRADENDAWWRRQLATAFQAVARRERISRRHAVMKRIQGRWPAAVEMTAQ
jgi:hypothetical protein